MTKCKAVKPWTWEEIGALEGKALAAFMAAYGERAKAARMVACHLMRERGEIMRIPCAAPTYWDVAGCPAGIQSPWSNPSDPGGCIERSPLVYARMIEALGRMPE